MIFGKKIFAANYYYTEFPPISAALLTLRSEYGPSTDKYRTSKPGAYQISDQVKMHMKQVYKPWKMK